MTSMNQYKIYDPKINDFYNDIFMKNIRVLIKNNKKYVDTSFITKNKKDANPSNKIKITKLVDKQQERIIGDYLIPLSYLIYSYIYQKFYVMQQRKDIIMENKLNYTMYQYFFSHKNPIIKKVNVYFYNSYNNISLSKSKNNKNIEPKFNSDGDMILPKDINQYVIPEIRKGKTKDDLIAFLNEINNKIKQNDDDILIDETMQKLKNLKKNMGNIIDDYNDIIISFQSNLKEKKNQSNNKKEGLEKQMNDLYERISTLTNGLEKKTEEKETLISNIKDLNKSKKEEEDKLKKYTNSRVDYKKGASNALQKEIKRKQDEKNKLQELKTKKTELQRDIDIKRKEFESTSTISTKNSEKKESDCEKTLEKIKNEIVLINKNILEETRKLTDINNNIQTKEDEINNKITGCDGLNRNSKQKCDTELRKLKNDLDVLTNKKDELDNKLNELNAKLIKINENKTKTEKECKEYIERIQKNIEDKKITYQSDFDKLKTKIEQIDKDIETSSSEIESLDELIKSKTTEKETAENNSITKQQIAIHNTSISEIQKKIDENILNLNTIRNECTSYRKQIYKNTIEVKKFENDIKKYDEDLKELERQNTLIGEKLISINDNRNINEILKSLKYNNIGDYKIFLKYKNQYDIINKKYIDLCNIIKLINKNILKINIENKEILKEDNISIDEINKFIIKYTELNNKNKTKNIYDSLSIKNKEINSEFEDEKDLIKLLFNSLVNKNNKKQIIQNYIGEIFNIKINIINIILNIIYLFSNNKIILNNSSKLSHKYNTANIINIYKDIKNDINLPNQPLFKILYYIYKSIIYQEIIEYNYLVSITNSITEININYILIDDNMNISKIIKDLKYKYNNEYRKFKKIDNTDNNNLKIELLELKKKYKIKFTKYDNDIKSLDEELKIRNYNTKIKQKNQEFIDTNTLYKTKKTKKDFAKELLSELNIKEGNKSIYQTQLLSKIKNSSIKTQIEQSIKNLTSTGKINILNNNITKNKIYDIVKVFYEKNKDINYR
jgi:hypothetical protein